MTEQACLHASHCDCMLDERVRNDGANMTTVYCCVVRFPHFLLLLPPMNLFQSILPVDLSSLNWFRHPAHHADSDEMSENDSIGVVPMLVASIRPWAADYALVRNYNTDAVAVVEAVVAAVAAGALAVPPSEYELNSWLRDVPAMNFLASPHSYDPNH